MAFFTLDEDQGSNYRIFNLYNSFTFASKLAIALPILSSIDITELKASLASKFDDRPWKLIKCIPLLPVASSEPKVSYHENPFANIFKHHFPLINGQTLKSSSAYKLSLWPPGRSNSGRSSDVNWNSPRWNLIPSLFLFATTWKINTYHLSNATWSRQTSRYGAPQDPWPIPERRTGEWTSTWTLSQNYRWSVLGVAVWHSEM